MGGIDEAPADGRHPFVADDSDPDANEPIFKLAIDCARHFENLIKTPRIEETAQPANVRRFVEEYQRDFWTWARYVGVFAAGKASLDWRLRDNNGYRDLFLLALDMLRVNLLERKCSIRNP